MSGLPHKRKVLALDIKAKIIAEVMNGEKKKTVAKKYGISQSSLSTILKLKDSIIATVSASGSSTAKKNLKTAAYVDVEKALFTWFTDMRAKNVPLSGELL
ncbi:hypothetical protein HPB47_007045 [Ixodes persulcatus]|uniref:Uncharacterized protein n=1 Tax=Ixodes persulcatus TaxID=34615 RepID=A0AC60P8Q8_IXOPE|nr:hypothetical protein HPB47_007045 [Ixodes persulcatus]